MFRKFLFLFAFGGLFVSCSTKQDLDDRDAERVIRLGAGWVDSKLRTKAEVNSLADLAKPGVGDNIGIYGVSVRENSAAPVAGWGNDCPMPNVQTTAVSATNGTISWKDIYFYPFDDSYVKFCAYYPYASVEGNGRLRLEEPATGKAPLLRFTMNGQDDVMYAEPVVGRYDLAPATLMFRHVLTQLRFEIVDNSGALIGAEIRNIVIVDANTSSSMNIETGVLGAWDSKKDLSVPGIQNVKIESNAPQLIGQGIMLQPGLASFKVRVETSEGTYSTTVHPTSIIDGVSETTFAAERSYLISLYFDKSSELSASANVTDWVFAGGAFITVV